MTTETKASFSIFGFLKTDKEKQQNTSESLKEAVSNYLEESSSNEPHNHEEAEEKSLLSNVLTLKGQDVTDIMIPRADITAVEVSSSIDELFKLLTEKQFSRIPVYKDNLDEILGTIHIKDVLAKLVNKEAVNIKELIRKAPIVSPAMPILDLVQLMRQERRHMVMVVDEYGGIDGLVTIGDIIEEVLGEIDDEYDTTDQLKAIKTSKNTYVVDARIELKDLEEQIDQKFDFIDDDDVDTLGGLVSFLIGRLPSKGEIIETPQAPAKFKILDADPRRVKRVQINIKEQEAPLPEDAK